MRCSPRWTTTVAGVVATQPAVVCPAQRCLSTAARSASWRRVVSVSLSPGAQPGLPSIERTLSPGRSWLAPAPAYAGPYIGTMLTKVIFNDLTTEELQVAQDLALQVAEGATPELFGQLFVMCSDYLERAKSRGITGDGVLARLVDAHLYPVP